MTYFTDPMAAVEEAEFLANKNKKRMYVIEVEPNCIAVLNAEEAAEVDGLVLETIIPVIKKHDIF